MAVVKVLINGQVPVPVVAAPPPAADPAPPPPAASPASSSPQIDPALLAAAGVTQAQVDAANSAAAAAAAGAAALLAGEGSAGIANAEQAAGATQDVLDAITAAAIPDITNLDVGGSGGTGGSVGDTTDLAEAAAIANANNPDLSGLLSWELIDPYGVETLGVSNPPLKGGGALSAIAQACSDYGVDTRACVADGLHEGANGEVGDGGKSYGPFQLERGGRLPAQFNGTKNNDPVVNAWAWSENGIRYAVRGMATVKPSAKGLVGHPAVYAIVYGFELPTDKPGAYKARAAEYDHLVQLGSGWAAYAAPLFVGPIAGGGVDTTPIIAAKVAPYKPAGVVAQWRDFLDVFGTTIPKASTKVSSISDSLVEVFR